LCHSVGLYRGWFPVVASICCSNFIYFYVFNGFKAIAYKNGAKPYPAKDLIIAFLAGEFVVMVTFLGLSISLQTPEKCYRSSK